MVQVQEVKNRNHVINVNGEFFTAFFIFSDITRSHYTEHHEAAESTEKGQKPKEEEKAVDEKGETVETMLVASPMLS